MSGRDCLNKERKICNISYGSLVGGGLVFTVLALSLGLMWGMGGGAAGFIIGGWLSKEWFSGNIQRYIYWHLPIAKLLIDKEVPESHHRQVM